MVYIWISVLLIASVIGMIFLIKGIFNSTSAKLLINPPKDEPSTTKKYYGVDVDKYSALLVNIGLILSVGAVLWAFEHKDYDPPVVVELASVDATFEDVVDIPVTQQVTPPPPTITLPEIVEVKDDEEIKEVEVKMNTEVTEETVVEKQAEVVVRQEEEPEKEKVEEIFTVVEEGSEPTGGYEEFYKFIGKNTTYPKQARRMGIEGKVFVQFVVDKDGSLVDMKVVKGIGAGCDEEAMRVIQEFGKWKPGKQRGRNVKQRVIFPFSFKLAK